MRSGYADGGESQPQELIVHADQADQKWRENVYPVQ